MILAFWCRVQSPTALTGSILAFIGGMFVVCVPLMVGITLISLSGTVSAQGTILSCTFVEGGCQPIVSFRTPSDKLITFHSSSSSETYAPGGIVTVWYHPSNPQDAQVDPWAGIKALSLFFGGGGLAMALVGALLFLLAKDHPSAQLVHHYYTAIGNQDYATAFQDLSLSMKTPWGQPITQDWFIQKELKSDEVNGRVTNHTITNFCMTATTFSFRMTLASYTVKVARGEHVSKVYPRVVREGEQWKIVGFDQSQLNLLH